MGRGALSRERIVEAAVTVADDGGLTAVSMRNVGRRLGVEAMSLYHHLAGKDELLDELADWVFAQIELPEPGTPWRPAMAARAASARAVLARHPWSLGLVESRRSGGPALLRHHDTVLGCLRADGFTVALASQAFSAIDAYVYGFVLTETRLPFSPDDDVEDFVAEIALPAQEYPHLAEMVAELVVGHGYAFADQFDDGLDLVLDGLERRLAAAS
ncbi:TetR/AcrR family transcriptional regulator [Cellulosimicrobium protaetiae]|uniref:TetR/AcrR family transcriptional regulator n=1 Tax=Cellulosimicrobium protaetiae TaxID=2587808 RepID=A0A6M5UHZ0_9MICO|nr:TetR/AcrR family transcriptional regulator [Cellulosimicrobium protaetiae]QJW37152.1 TetR/AcrR family transcriptional regulator [Cellulosimicrobium protaetiae]